MMRSFLKLAAVCAVVLAITAGQAGAGEKLIPKVDSFVLFQDYSGSMQEQFMGERKIDLSKSLLTRMNERIPALGYTAAMSTFGPYSEVVAAGPYQSNGMDAGIAGLDTEFAQFGRQTPMGDGLNALGAVLDEMPGRKAVIIISDGEENRGADPLGVAKDLYAFNGGDLCFHVVSLADSPSGQALLDRIANLSDCSVTANAADLADDAALSQFVQDVFYKGEMTPEPMKEVVVMEMAEKIVFRSVVFDFDSAAIRSDMAPILDEAATIIDDAKGAVLVEGHTDSSGPEAYNQALSERRAASAKAYLAGKGVAADRITTKGLGESNPKYDNNTLDGRKLNRRVEITLQ
jgi:OmpA-OmpF porin, OOP family